MTDNQTTQLSEHEALRIIEASIRAEFKQSSIIHRVDIQISDDPVDSNDLEPTCHIWLWTEDHRIVGSGKGYNLPQAVANTALYESIDV